MEDIGDSAFILSVTDFTFNIVGVLLMVTDVTLDIWAVVTFYQEQAYVSMGVLIFLLLGSSTLLQVFSWRWYSYSSKEEREGLKKHVYLQKYLNNRCLLGLLHWCHLGVIFRFVGVMEISLRSLQGQRSKRSEGKPSEVSESLEEGTTSVEQQPLDAGKFLEENKIMEEDIHSGKDMTDNKPLEVDKLLIERKPLEVSKPTEKNESSENNKFFQMDIPSKDKRALEEDTCGKQRQLENNTLYIGKPKEQNKPSEGAKSSEKDKEEEGGIAVYMTHDLRMLRLFEAFTENTPQLTLMLTVIAQRENVEWVTGLKALGSFAAITFSILTYHRSMRAFTEGKKQLTITSSFIFFLWNLLLLIPRVAAVALSASTLPLGMIAVHFTCVWLTLLLWLWLQETDFMDDNVPNSKWEWLYRATIALILYFSWFNVSDGRTRERSIIYHSFMALDITLLLVLWWWDIEYDAAVFGMPVLGVFIFLGTSYTLGLLVRIVYHKLFHPKKSVKKSGTDDEIAPACLAVPDTEAVVLCMDEVDFQPSPPPPPATPSPPQHKALTATEKRMMKMARNV